MPSKHKSSDAGNLTYQRESCKLYAQEKHSLHKVWYYLEFQAFTGGLETYIPPDKRGGLLYNPLVNGNCLYDTCRVGDTFAMRLDSC